MSIFESEPEVRRNDTNRSIVQIWDLSDGVDIIDDDGDTVRPAAMLTVMHFKDRKQFFANVQRVDVGHRPGFRTEKYQPMSGTRVRLTSTPCARYSAKALEDATIAATAELRSMINDPAIIAVGDPDSPA